MVLVDSETLNGGLTAIADAIRARTGDSAMLSFPNGMASAISGIVGMAGNSLITVTVDRYTVASDTGNYASGGNTQNFINNYFPRNAGEYVIAIISDSPNALHSYDGVGACKNGRDSSSGISFFRYNSGSINVTSEISSGYTFRLYACQTVTVYRIGVGI